MATTSTSPVTISAATQNQTSVSPQRQTSPHGERWRRNGEGRAAGESGTGAAGEATVVPSREAIMTRRWYRVMPVGHQLLALTVSRTPSRHTTHDSRLMTGRLPTSDSHTV